MSTIFESNMDRESLLSVAQSFVPLCSLRPSYLEFLILQQGRVEYAYSGLKVVERGVCDYHHIYLLNGSVTLQFASGFKKSVDANEYLSPVANEMPRPCDVVAETDCTLLFIASDYLDRILSWSQISQYLLSELSFRRDYDEDIDWIQTVLNSNLFYKVPPVNAEQILGRMKSQVVEKNELIIHQGEIGDCCYFIKEGSASVSRYDDRNNVIHLADIGVGRCFGEDALVYEAIRNASVKMLTDGVLMRLDKVDFRLLLLEPNVVEVVEGSASHFLEAPVYIDVRTLEEYDEGHLSMSVSIPLSLLAMEKRLLNINVPYILYCDTGRRSRSAAYLLGKQGFQTASLQGGLLGAGMQYQLIRDSGYILKDGRVHKVVN